jgi:hypothetical protein
MKMLCKHGYKRKSEILLPMSWDSSVGSSCSHGCELGQELSKLVGKLRE